MNKEELLKEAKLRYPKGCRIKSAKSGNEMEVTHMNTTLTQVGIDNSGRGYLWYDNKWAEIVSYPENYIPLTESILKNVVIWQQKNLT